MYLCLQAVKKKHRQDPRFEKELKRRQEEYKRKTMKHAEEERHMKEIMDEGYSDVGADVYDDSDDEEESDSADDSGSAYDSEDDPFATRPHHHFTVS